MAGQWRELSASGRLKAGDVLPGEDGPAARLGGGRKVVRHAVVLQKIIWVQRTVFGERHPPRDAVAGRNICDTTGLPVSIR